MSKSNAFRTFLSVVTLLLALARLVRWQNWSVITTTAIFVVFTVACFAIIYLINKKSKEATRSNNAAENRPKKVGPLFTLYLGVVAVLFVFMAGKMAYLAGHLLYLESAERTWATVDATIVDSSLQSSTSKRGYVTWSPVWTYSYAINGRPYLSQSTGVPGGYDAHWYHSKKLAEEEATSRAVGHSVLAYYDPDDPHRSVLDRRTPSNNDWLPLGMAVFIFALVALTAGRLRSMASGTRRPI